MKRAAVLILTVLTLAATGCASAPARAAATALFRNDAPPASATPVVVNCLLKPQTRPSSFILTCADAGDVLADLHWVSWGSAAGFGTAVEQINDCTPDCAGGKFIN